MGITQMKDLTMTMNQWDIRIKRVHLKKSQLLCSQTQSRDGLSSYLTMITKYLTPCGHRDLAIFKTKIDIKGLSFESEELYDGETASLHGYYDNNDGNLLINQSRGIVRLKPFWDEKNEN